LSEQRVGIERHGREEFLQLHLGEELRLRLRRDGLGGGRRRRGIDRPGRLGREADQQAGGAADELLAEPAFRRGAFDAFPVGQCFVP
jgi:hypothetical protein